MRMLILSCLFVLVVGGVSAADWQDSAVLSRCMNCDKVFDNPKSVMFDACFRCGVMAAARLSVAESNAKNGSAQKLESDSYLVEQIGKWYRATDPSWVLVEMTFLFYDVARRNPKATLTPFE